MWIVSYAGDDRAEPVERWLRPGQTFTAGRLSRYSVDGSRGENDFVVNDRSVSKIHLRIKVDKVPTKGSEYAGQKTKIWVEDCGTKYGTKVGNQLISANSPFEVTSYQKVHIELGTKVDALTLEWRNVLFSLSLDGSLEERNKKCESIRAKLEPMDIKCLTKIHPYTTCLIKEKGNSPKILSALVRAIPVVNMNYIDAVVNATHKLEKNFASFPKSGEYVYSFELDSNEKRKRLFEGLVFFTFSESQREALLDVVTQAKGKVYCVEVGKKTADKAAAIVKFIKENSGTKVPVIMQPDGFLSGENSELGEAAIQACHELETHLRNSKDYYTAIITCNPDPLISNIPSQTIDPIEDAPIMETVAQQHKEVAKKPQKVKLPVRPSFLPAIPSQPKRRNASQESQLVGVERSQTPPTQTQTTQQSQPQTHTQTQTQTQRPVKRPINPLDIVSKPLPTNNKFTKRKATDDGNDRPAKSLRTQAPIETVTRTVAPIEEYEPLAAPPVASPLPKRQGGRGRGRRKEPTPPLAPQLEPDVGEVVEEPPEPDMNFEEMTLQEIRNLVIVDDLEIQPRPTEQRQHPRQNFDGVPNFKRFKKNKLPPSRTNKVECVTGSQHADGLEQDAEERMFVAMSQRQSQLKHPRQDQDSQQLPETKRRKITFDSDSDLEVDEMFVPSDDDIQSQQSRSRTESPRSTQKSQSGSQTQSSSSRGGQSQSKSRGTQGRKVQQRITTANVNNDDDDDDSDEDNFKFTT